MKTMEQVHREIEELRQEVDKDMKIWNRYAHRRQKEHDDPIMLGFVLGLLCGMFLGAAGMWCAIF